MTTLLLVSLLTAADPPRITDHNFNGWIMYFGDHQIKGKWGVHLEAQWRRAEGFNAWQQNFFRPAVNYDVKPWMQLALGYTYVKTFPYGEFPFRQAFDEHRIYQQVILRHPKPFGRVRLQHRFRLEQRWLDVQANVPQGPLPHLNWRLQGRFRWFTRADIPINEKFYVGAYNELLIHLPPNLGPRKLDQNRAYVAIGRRFGANFRVEGGYMNQYLAQRNGRILESNHTMQLAIFSNLSFRGRQK